MIEADETTTGVEMHKDSRFSQSWQNFKDSNPVMNKFVDYRSTTSKSSLPFKSLFIFRVKFEESDSALARGARLVTDKVHEISDIQNRLKDDLSYHLKCEGARYLWRGVQKF